MYVVIPRGRWWFPLAIAGGLAAGTAGVAVPYALGMDYVAGWLGSGIGWVIGVWTAYTIVKTEPPADLEAEHRG